MGGGVDFWWSDGPSLLSFLRGRQHKQGSWWEEAGPRVRPCVAVVPDRDGRACATTSACARSVKPSGTVSRPVRRASRLAKAEPWVAGDMATPHALGSLGPVASEIFSVPPWAEPEPSDVWNPQPCGLMGSSLWPTDHALPVARGLRPHLASAPPGHGAAMAVGPWPPAASPLPCAQTSTSVNGTTGAARRSAITVLVASTAPATVAMHWPPTARPAKVRRSVPNAPAASAVFLLGEPLCPVY